MTRYKCGHSNKVIILSDDIMSLLGYDEWTSTVGLNGTKEQCWDCWYKEMKQHD